MREPTEPRLKTAWAGFGLITLLGAKRMREYIRDATIDDLPRIVSIYNAAIPHKVHGDIVPVTVEKRIQWFQAHNPQTRPLWVLELGGEIVAWASLSDFYGRPAYSKTAEISSYCAPVIKARDMAHSFLDSLRSRVRVSESRR